MSAVIPYAFWCSRCKRDHAGECSDRKPTCMTCVAGFCKCDDGTMTYPIPGVGTQWRKWLRDDSNVSHGWARLATHEVLKVEGQIVTCRQVNKDKPGPADYYSARTYHARNWSNEGFVRFRGLDQGPPT